MRQTGSNDVTSIQRNSSARLFLGPNRFRYGKWKHFAGQGRAGVQGSPPFRLAASRAPAAIYDFFLSRQRLSIEGDDRLFSAATLTNHQEDDALAQSSLKSGARRRVQHAELFDARPSAS